jgi:hypothetical protein
MTDLQPLLLKCCYRLTLTTPYYARMNSKQLCVHSQHLASCQQNNTIFSHIDICYKENRLIKNETESIIE